jgi:hypothetical protein
MKIIFPIDQRKYICHEKIRQSATFAYSLSLGEPSARQRRSLKKISVLPRIFTIRVEWIRGRQLGRYID